MLKLIHGLPTSGKSFLVDRELQLLNSPFSFIYDPDSFDKGVPGWKILKHTDLQKAFVDKSVEARATSYKLKKNLEKNKATMVSSLISLNGVSLCLSNTYFRNLTFDFSFIVSPETLLKRWMERERHSELNIDVATRWVADAIIWAKRNNVPQIMLEDNQYISSVLSFMNRNGAACFVFNSDVRFVNFGPIEHLLIMQANEPVLVKRDVLIANYKSSTFINPTDLLDELSSGLMGEEVNQKKNAVESINEFKTVDQKKLNFNLLKETAEQTRSGGIFIIEYPYLGKQIRIFVQSNKGKLLIESPSKDTFNFILQSTMKKPDEHSGVWLSFDEYLKWIGVFEKAKISVTRKVL